MKRIFEFWKDAYRLKIILVYDFVILLATILFYFFIPIIMNYPKEVEELDQILNVPPHIVQYSFLYVVIVTISNLFLLKALKVLKNYKNIINNTDSESVNKINIMRNIIVRLPIKIYLSQIIFILGPVIIIIGILLAVIGTSPVFLLKISIILFSFFSLIGVVSLLFSKSIFIKVLKNTFNTKSISLEYYSLKKKLLFQIFPTVIVAILITGFVGYSRLIYEKAEIISNNYKHNLDILFDKEPLLNETQIEEKLKNMVLFNNKTDKYFILDAKLKQIQFEKITFDPYFMSDIRYADQNNGHIYTLNDEENGTIKRINSSNGTYIVGVKFIVASSDSFIYFISSFIFLIILNFLILYYVSKSISNDISSISKGLKQIAESKDIMIENPIPVTSDDEIGQLVESYNIIQKRMIEHEKTIASQYAVMQKDLKIGKNVQGSLLGDLPGKIGNLSLYLEKHPMSEVSGDFYSIVETRDNKQFFIMGDVSGHGVSAALVTILAKNLFNTVVRELLLLQKDFSTAEVCNIFNKRLFNEISDSGLYMTGIIMKIDTDKNIIEFTNAGHTMPLLFKKSDGKIIELFTHDTMLGILETTYSSQMIEFTKGDKLLLFTDGLSEVKNDEDKEFSTVMQRYYVSYAESNVINIAKTLYQKAEQYCNKNFNDDVTVISLENN